MTISTKHQNSEHKQLSTLVWVGLAGLGLGFIVAIAFFTYQSPTMAFWLDGFGLCN